VFLLVELLLKREKIFIPTRFHIPVPNNTHSDSNSFFFFCQDLPASLRHVAVHILVFLIPKSFFSFTTDRHLEQEAADHLKRPQALNTYTVWSSGKLQH